MFFNAFRHKTGGDFYFKSNVVRNIQLTCQSSETGIFFYNRAFTSTNKLYLEHIQTDNCNGGYHTLSAEFRFLTKLTFSRAISPDLVYLPKSVTMLNITHSPEFQGVNLNGNPNDIICSTTNKPCNRLLFESHELRVPLPSSLSSEIFLEREQNE